jgi:hypothetical protein
MQRNAKERKENSARFQVKAPFDSGTRILRVIHDETPAPHFKLTLAASEGRLTLPISFG